MDLPARLVIYELFSCSPPTCRLCHHAGKPIESVVYCLNKLYPLVFIFHTCNQCYSPVNMDYLSEMSVNPNSSNNCVTHKPSWT